MGRRRPPNQNPSAVLLTPAPSTLPPRRPPRLLDDGCRLDVPWRPRNIAAPSAFGAEKKEAPHSPPARCQCTSPPPPKKMQQERQAPAQPPAYTQHDPNTLNLPSVPTHSLPPLRSLDLGDAHHPSHPDRATIELSPKSRSDAQWGHLPPLTSATFPRAPDGDIGSPMDTSSVVSAGDDAAGHRRETSVLSVDDPDVRLAAEALSGLGNPGRCFFFRNMHIPEPRLDSFFEQPAETASLTCLWYANLDTMQTLPARPPRAPSLFQPANAPPRPNRSRCLIC